MEPCAASRLLTLLAALAASSARQLGGLKPDTRDSNHPNSVYSMMDQHSTKEKSRAKSKYKGKEGVKIFYQTGVSKCFL